MTVLAATDFSEHSQAALRLGAREARLRDVPLVVLHCLEAAASGLSVAGGFDPLKAAPDQLRDETLDKMRDFVDDILHDDERPETIECEAAFEHPTEGIQLAARDHDAALIAQGTAGRGRLGSVVLGSTAEEVVRSTTRPVLTVPRDAQPGPCEHIVAPVDFSPCSQRALEVAVEVARRDKGTITVLHETAVPSEGIGRPEMGPSERVIEAYREEIEERLRSWLEGLGLERVDIEEALNVRPYKRQDPSEAILETVRTRQADLVVMGTHGRRGFTRFLLGSTTMQVLHNIPCPLLTVCMAAGDSD